MYTVVAAVAVAASSVVHAPSVDAGAWSSTARPPVVVVGDSLTAENAVQIDAHLRGAGVDGVHLAGLGGRRIDVDYEFFGWNNSGRDEIDRLRRAGHDPLVWLIELGTNDLRELAACGCDDPAARASRLIDVILSAVGGDSDVVWVTVHDRDAPVASAVFNSELQRRAALGHIDALADWDGLASTGSGWFRDHVHPNHIGAAALAGVYVEAIDGYFERQAMNPLERVRVRLTTYM